MISLTWVLLIKQSGSSKDIEDSLISHEHPILFDISEINNIPIDAIITLAAELKKNSKKLADPTEFSRGGKSSVENILRDLPEIEAVEFLKEISRDTGGVFTPTFEQLFNENESVVRKVQLWPYLAVIALLLYFLDLVLRRVRLFESVSNNVWIFFKS